MFYLAYGSNLHPARLGARVASARYVGNVRLPNFQLRFHKRSVDGSGKCSFVDADDGDSAIWCAVYELERSDKARLDRVEGLGNGYDEQRVPFNLNGDELQGSIYRASTTHVDDQLEPYSWYREMVLLGALYRHFPAAYVDAIRRTECVADPDSDRARENGLIVAEMRVATPDCSSRID